MAGSRGKRGRGRVEEGEGEQVDVGDQTSFKCGGGELEWGDWPMLGGGHGWRTQAVHRAG